MSTGGGQSPEKVVDLLVSYIKANIDTALAVIRTDRVDPRITTPSPAEYFISEQYDAYRSPAIFVIADSIDFKVEQMGSNFYNQTLPVNVHCVVEDATEEVLMRRVYRYQGALRSILHEANLTTPNSGLKMVVVVERARFSQSTPNQKGGESAKNFRKECVLECTVRCFENF